MNSSGVTSAWRKSPASVPTFDFAMQWHDAAFGVSLHDDVASALAQLLKPEPLERTLNFGAGDVR